MGPKDADLEEREAALDDVFPGLSDQSAVVASGDDLEQALVRSERCRRALIDAGVATEAIVSISPFLPSRASQQASANAAREAFDGGELRATFVQVGFKEAFVDGLSSRLDVAPLVPADFADTSLATMIDDAVHERDGRVHVLTRVRASDDDELNAIAAAVEALEGVRLVSQRLETRATLETMQLEMARMLGIWILMALVGLSLVQRSLRFGVLATLPALFGVLAAAGLFGALGRPLTPVAAAGLTLVMGLGIDYGIFVLHSARERAREVAPAVFASALTTLAAFGVLASARTRAMSDLGLAILVGVTCAMLAAVVLLPALVGRRKESE